MWDNLTTKTPDEVFDNMFKGTPGDVTIRDIYGGSKEVSFRALVRDAGGDIASMTRTFMRADGKLIVEHDLFKVAPAHRGFAKQFLRDSFDAYVDMGVDSVRVHANIDVGGYAWLKYGFSPNASSTKELWDRAKSELDWYKEEIVDSLGEDVYNNLVITLERSPNVQDLWDLSDLNGSVFVGGKPTTVGKLFFLESNWYGALNTHDVASVERFLTYVEK